jgi:hypothetical protein
VVLRRECWPACPTSELQPYSRAFTWTCIEDNRKIRSMKKRSDYSQPSFLARCIFSVPLYVQGSEQPRPTYTGKQHDVQDDALYAHTLSTCGCCLSCGRGESDGVTRAEGEGHTKRSRV